MHKIKSEIKNNKSVFCFPNRGNFTRFIYSIIFFNRGIQNFYFDRKFSLYLKRRKKLIMKAEMSKKLTQIDRTDVLKSKVKPKAEGSTPVDQASETNKFETKTKTKDSITSTPVDQEDVLQRTMQSK